jgi:hypothetical protein
MKEYEMPFTTTPNDRRRANHKAQLLNEITSIGWKIYEEGGNPERLDDLEKLIQQFAREFPTSSNPYELALVHPENTGNDAVTRWEKIAADVLNSGVLRRSESGIIAATDAQLGETLELAVLQQYQVRMKSHDDSPLTHFRTALVRYPMKLTGGPLDEITAIIPREELTNERVWDWLVEDVYTRLNPLGVIRLEIQPYSALAPLPEEFVRAGVLQGGKVRPAINPTEMPRDTRWYTALSNTQQLRHPHVHETWQVDVTPEGGYYCRACGQMVEPEPAESAEEAERAEPAPAVDGWEILTTGVGLTDDTAWSLIEASARWSQDERENLMSWLIEKGVIERRRPLLPQRTVRIGNDQPLPPGNYKIQLVYPGDTHPDDILVQGPKALVDPTAGSGQRAYFKVLGIETDQLQTRPAGSADGIEYLDAPDVDPDDTLVALAREKNKLKHHLRQDLPEGFDDELTQPANTASPAPQDPPAGVTSVVYNNRDPQTVATTRPAAPTVLNIPRMVYEALAWRQGPGRLRPGQWRAIVTRHGKNIREALPEGCWTLQLITDADYEVKPNDVVIALQQNLPLDEKDVAHEAYGERRGFFSFYRAVDNTLNRKGSRGRKKDQPAVLFVSPMGPSRERLPGWFDVHPEAPESPAAERPKRDDDPAI